MKPNFLKSSGTAGLLSIILLPSLLSCSSPSDFQPAGKPELTLKRIEVISQSKEITDQAIEEVQAGKISEAEALFKKALKLALPNKELKLAYDCYLNIGRCEEIKENLDEAENYFKQTLAFAQKHFPNDKSKLSDAIASLGVVLAKKGDAKGAEKLLRKAVEMRKSQENWSMALDHTLKLKWFYEHTKQPAKLVDTYEDLISLHMISGAKDPLVLARFHIDQAKTELLLRRDDNAFRSLKEAQQALQKEASIESAKLQIELAESFRELGKTAESNRVLAASERILKENKQKKNSELSKETPAKRESHANGKAAAQGAN
ncbi:MAG: tetratricopeptide repeat protein [Candidatus Obscuribacterales bacterium]|jgi:tetratricopeptide (TPR) repeat protein|nr:tetratricopeptide repeat protein [Candidatus Obscuribacterales bacterium]